MTTIDPRNRVAMENDGSRVDARLKVTGGAKYTRDINLANQVYAIHVRSPFAEGKLKSADLAAARAIKGILDVQLYGSDRRGNPPVSSIDEVRQTKYSGEPVGHVCGESRQVLHDAIAALKMDWDYGEPTTNFRRETGSLPDLTEEDAAKLEEIADKAAFETKGSNYYTQVQHHVSLETHSCVVDYQGDKARVWGSTQANFGFRSGVSRVMGLDASAVEMNCEFVGGGYGSKFGHGVEAVLAAQMSMKFKRPCKVENTRKAENQDTGMRPGSRQYYKLFADENGKILGGQFQSWGETGASGGQGGVRPVRYPFSGSLVPGGRARHKDIAMSSCAGRPQRAPGHPQASFAMDGVLDELAAEVGMDPLEFRKLNDGHETRLAQYDIAAKEIGWDRRKPDGQSPGTLKRGFGIGVNTWGNRPGGGIKIDLRIYPDGKLEVRSGIQDIGTGSRTILVDLVAYKMGLSRDFIIGACGRTDLPNGPGSGGSTVSRSIAPSVFHAADNAVAAMLELAAKELGTSDDKLAIKGDAIVDKADGSQKMTWLQACKLIPSDHLEISGKAERGDAFYGEGDSEGVVMCEAEVDTETGVVKIIKLVNVQACGKPINRKTVESQIVGGTIAGLGFALLEERILDAENGAQVNPNMEAYKLPGPADMPEIVPIIFAPDHFTGVRALGEPAHVGITGAIGNAVANAIGARVYSMPITPAKVMAALNG